MDQLNIDEIKARVRRHLATTKEATAKIIAKATGDDPHFVIKALNIMRTDTEVECEKKKGKGNEFWYWLTHAETAPAATGEDSSAVAQADTEKVALRPGADSPCCNGTAVMATTAVQVTGEYRAKLDEKDAEIRLLNAELAALRPHSHMLGQIAELVEKHQQTSDCSTVDVVKFMARRIEELEVAVDAAQNTIHQQELEAEQHRERIASLEGNGDLLAAAPAETGLLDYSTLDTFFSCTMGALTEAGFEDIGNPAEPIQILVNERTAWRQMAEHYDCRTPDELAAVIDIKQDGLEQLRKDHDALTKELAKAGKPPFYVSIGRDTGPQIHKDIGPATERMKSIVRKGDPAGLVLVPILKAVKGVEVVEIKAAA